MRKGSQSWHFVANKVLEETSEISPKELAEKLGVHHLKAAKLLKSLGWFREKSGDVVTFSRNKKT